jgi:hypothetical protein
MTTTKTLADTQGCALGYRIAPLRGSRPETCNHARRALTLVEIVVATLIVGIMTVAALNGLGAATRSSITAGNRVVAHGLVDELMADILALSYDDLDDYEDWDEPLTGDRADWTRRSTVELVTAADPTETSNGVDEGVKRIWVFVDYKGRQLAQGVALRTDTD